MEFTEFPHECVAEVVVKELKDKIAEHDAKVTELIQVFSYGVCVLVVFQRCLQY